MKLRSATESAIRTANARVRLGFPFWMRPFLFRGVIALTLGRTIYLARDAVDIDRLIRHELVHVEQVGRLGLLRFLLRYVREYVLNRRRGLKAAEAYRRISFEEEAFAAEEEDL
jgi:Domain of unknown function (DUF4157)